MMREDGSIQSANTPAWNARYSVTNFGLHRGVVRDIVYIDDETNDSGNGSPNEVLYIIQGVGGPLDGQIFKNARLKYNLGGFANYEQVVLKKTEGLTGLDPSSLLALADPSISNLSTFNGDVIYFEFLHGDLHMPVITGFAQHQKAPPGASSDEGQVFSRKFNGITTSIDADGVYTWIKDNGAFLPVGANSVDPAYPLINQFSPFPGMEEAVRVSLDNQYNFEFSFPLLGLALSVSGLQDSIALATSAGAAWTLSGLTDSFQVATLIGTSLSVNGLTDTFSGLSASGAGITVSGLQDSVSLQTASGHSVLLNATGVALASAAGDSLSLGFGVTTLITGLGSYINAGALISVGNSAGSAFSVLADLLQALTTEAPAGFGAPLVNLATYIQLLAKIKTIAE